MKIAFCIASPVLALLVAWPLLGAGRAFRVKAFPNARSSDATGDRAPGVSGAFWFPSGDYDNPTGGQIPKVVRLFPDGSRATWTLNTNPESFAPTALRLTTSGLVWVLVPRFAEGLGALYSLNPQTNAVIRYPLPFAAFSLALDPRDGTPWVGGTGKLAKLVGQSPPILTVFAIENFEGGISAVDGTWHIWLSADNGSFRSFAIDGSQLDVYRDADGGMTYPAVDAFNRVWSIREGQNRLMCFTPATREQAVFPLVMTAANWGGVGVGSGPLITTVSAYGPHVQTHVPAEMTDGTFSTLAAPESSMVLSLPLPIAPQALFAPVVSDTVESVERIVYAEGNAGRSLFKTDGIGYTTMLWSDGNQFLTGSGPIQWWQPLGSGESFTTRAVLPVALTVRPESPTDNFFTEVTLTNLDASPAASLVFTTSTGVFTVPVTLAPGSTRIFPDVIQSLRDLGAALPASAVGTLEARFTNGTGVLAARVYTRFGAGAPFPAGSTTGLGFTSLDPAEEIFVSRVTLNGLKNTTGFRTNVAFANLCGGSGGTCPTVSLNAQFYDDMTGQRVGEKSVNLPPGQFLQLNAPLADFGVTGETFTVTVQPFSASSGFDAYATVVSNTNQDAAFIRASAAANSYTETLPVVVDAQGQGTRFTSECSITSTSTVDAVADVTFTSAGTGAQVKEVLTLAPGRGVRYPNAVDHFRKLEPSKVGADDFGSIRIAFRSFASGFASSRTTATNGTGLAFIAIDPFLTRAQRRKRVIGLKQTDAYRTNLAIVHLGATTNDANAPITLKVSVQDKDGNFIGQPLTKALAPGQLFQWNKILSDALGVTGEGYVATIERVAGADGFDAYITVIDNVSTDSTFLRAE